MSGVKGSWEARLSIAGKDVLVTPAAFPSIEVRASIHASLPSFSISVNDANGYIIDNYDMVDGAPVQIYLGDGRGNGQSYSMVMQGGPKDLITNGAGATYGLSGVMDNTDWLRKIYDKPTNGTSADVLKQMAEMVGLQFEGDGTSDGMVWLPNLMPFSQYSRFVTQRGYASASSIMMQAITETGKLLYKDVDKIIASGPAITFSNHGNGHPFMRTELDSKAGAYNNNRGYGSSTVIEQLDGTVKELNKIVSTKLSNFLNVGGGIASKLGALGGRVEFMPMNGGNTHAKWEEAIHQNRRGKALFAQDIGVYTDVFSGLELLKLAEYVPNPGGATLKAYAGKYVSTAKVLGFYGGNASSGRYVEKQVLTSQGPSESAGGGLL